jgi:hypothetical protein
MRTGRPALFDPVTQQFKQLYLPGFEVQGCRCNYCYAAGVGVDYDTWAWWIKE